jgi:hypothetical protein
MFTLTNILRAFDNETKVKIYTTRLNTMVSPLISTKYNECSNLTLVKTGMVKDLTVLYKNTTVYVCNCYVQDDYLIILVDDISYIY